ncbi:MAG TPA: FlgD immunoglobulin-like domain containing protein, partial [Candidatus Syntrophosphaera sp.]|nr:FlgD immunoglobulin-like domain containing protein [Candidatus Syntrophosphaera sp.]
NPFNPETTIGFDLPKSGHANLSVYNVKGQLVKTITDGNLEFGKHSFVWNGTDNDGRNVSSGIYFYRLTANGNVETKKMMLMK